MKKLNDKEVAMLEKNDLFHKFTRMELLVEQKNLEILFYKQKLMAVEIGQMQAKIETMKGLEFNALETKKGFVETMKKKHKLTGRWGYDPESGEIKEDHTNGN
jgi:hypothetical protein